MWEIIWSWTKHLVGGNSNNDGLFFEEAVLFWIGMLLQVSVWWWTSDNPFVWSHQRASYASGDFDAKYIPGMVFLIPGIARFQ
jgi:hypothetical protein